MPGFPIARFSNCDFRLGFPIAKIKMKILKSGMKLTRKSPANQNKCRRREGTNPNKGGTRAKAAPEQRREPQTESDLF